LGILSKLFKKIALAVVIIAILLIVMVIISSLTLYFQIKGDSIILSSTMKSEAKKLKEQGKDLDALLIAFELLENSNSEGVEEIDSLLAEIGERYIDDPIKYFSMMNIISSSIVTCDMIKHNLDTTSLLDLINSAKRDYTKYRMSEFFNTVEHEISEFTTDKVGELSNLIIRACYEFGDEVNFYVDLFQIIEEAAKKLTDYKFADIYFEIQHALDIANQISLQGLPFSNSNLDKDFVRTFTALKSRYLRVKEQKLLNELLSQKVLIESINGTETSIDKEALLFEISKKVDEIRQEILIDEISSEKLRQILEELADELDKAHKYVFKLKNAKYNSAAIYIIDQAFSLKKEPIEAAKLLSNLDQSRFTPEVSTYYMNVISKIMQDLKEKELKEFIETLIAVE